MGDMKLLKDSNGPGGSGDTGSSTGGPKRTFNYSSSQAQKDFIESGARFVIVSTPYSTGATWLKHMFTDPRQEYGESQQDELRFQSARRVGQSRSPKCATDVATVLPSEIPEEGTWAHVERSTIPFFKSKR